MRTDIACEEVAQNFPLSRQVSGPGLYEGEARVSTSSSKYRSFIFQPLNINRDASLLHRWFTEERATFWNMRDKSVSEVAAVYQALMDSASARAYIGTQDDVPACLIECYDPAHDEIGEHYAVQPGDMGMHLFVAPASSPVHGYTRFVFAVVMTFMFDTLMANRIVVEPDIRNTRIHALNRAMGFVYSKDVAFREKTASLAFCTRHAFQSAMQKETRS